MVTLLPPDGTLASVVGVTTPLLPTSGVSLYCRYFRSERWFYVGRPEAETLKRAKSCHRDWQLSKPMEGGFIKKMSTPGSRFTIQLVGFGKRQG